MVAKCLSRWPLALTPHNVLLSEPCLPGQSCSDLPPAPRPGSPSQGDPRGCWALTLRGQTRIPRETREGSCTTALRLAAGPGHPPPPQLRELPADRSAQCPPRMPHLLSLRAAGGRGVAPGWSSSPRRAPRGSVVVCCAPGASTQMGRCRPPSCWPHPRPAPGPTRPGEKALIGKITQERGGGSGGWPAGARRELRRLGSRRRPPTPDEMSSPSADGEGWPGGSAEPTSQPSSEGHLLQGAVQSCAPPPFTPSLGLVGQVGFYLRGGSPTGPSRYALSASHLKICTGAGTRTPRRANQRLRLARVWPLPSAKPGLEASNRNGLNSQQHG